MIDSLKRSRVRRYERAKVKPVEEKEDDMKEVPRYQLLRQRNYQLLEKANEMRNMKK